MTPTFWCVKYKGELYPIDTWMYDLSDLNFERKKVWIRGVGEKQISRKSFIEVPRYSMQSEDWNAYIEQWGYKVLFFSLTNELYGSFNACLYHAYYEFNEVVRLRDIEKYVTWLEKVEHLQSLCQPKLEEYAEQFGKWGKIPFIDEHTIKPQYSFSVPGVGAISMPPHLSTVDDDMMFDHLYWKIKLPEYSDPNGHIIWDEAFQVRNDIADGKLPDWPVCTKDKIIKLFGDEAAQLYEECISI